MNKKKEYIKAEAKIVCFVNEDIITASMCQTQEAAQTEGEACGKTHQNNCSFSWLFLSWLFEVACNFFVYD